MLAVNVILLLLVVALLVLRERDARQLQQLLAAGAVERDREAALLERALTRAEGERASLLDRIQHPQRVQVAPVEREAPEPPRDGAEMAYVGQIVPDGVQVGSGPDNA